MATKDFTTTLLTDQGPHEVFNAIINVRGWWSEEIEGGASKLNDEFNYHFEVVHRCKIRLTEVIPDNKVVWLVLDNYFNFIKDENEWKGTKVIFEITRQDNKTKLQFTHEGLVPSYECFDVCKNAWTQYIQQSLYKLITTGKGAPNGKEKPKTEDENKLLSVKVD
jgi:Activator of Hsp90 ATPase homolog 1-like protein